MPLKSATFKKAKRGDASHRQRYYRGPAAGKRGSWQKGKASRSCGPLFQAEFDVLLYDLTSTYVEGAAEENPMMRRGYSRDHRPDREQLVLALIVNQDGFPFKLRPRRGK
jgi:hypothetical protein